ncbi:hypothetical protein BD779DRAFT_1569320 [Infundibulicybe gibba]|nr:hypothetical protein BD779DRAFT_1569320 [Infundibulicybe gibba]
MKVLSLFLTLLLTIASSVITNARSSILKAWEDKRNSNKLSGHKKLIALADDFTKITVDQLRKAVPGAKIIVVLGKHQFTDVKGPMDRYDEPIVIGKYNLKYTVIIFHVGKLTLESDRKPQGLSQGLILGPCEPDEGRKVWNCRESKAREGQKKL